MTRDLPGADRPRAFSRNPLFWLAACFSAGIFVSSFVPPGFAVPALAATLLAALALALRNRPDAGVVLAVAFIFGGVACMSSERISIKPDRLRVLYDTGQIAS